MKFTLDLENKTIKIHGSFTQKDLNEIFNVLNIEDISEYTIETTPSTSFWLQSNTGTLGIQQYKTNNTLNGTGKVVYNNILEELY
jgi:hypothetical protein|tara:strand:+ start:1229 stop:1483 length:255 start_codon:yes stop_codon:yes gene_type:complete